MRQRLNSVSATIKALVVVSCILASQAVTEQQKSIAAMHVAQANTYTERLNNAVWQEVPGADVGCDPIPTRIDMNGIIRNGNLVVFDATGYQGFYYRLEGDCTTREVRILRHGMASGETEFTYTEGAREELANRMLGLHLQLLDFACNAS